MENAKVPCRLTSLRIAVINRNKEKIFDLIQHGDINLTTVNWNGDTMLHLALGNDKCSQNNIITILNIFIERGVDPNIKNAQEKTVMHIAVERHLKDVVDFLLKHNCNIYVTDSEGNTIAHYFIEREYHKTFVKFCMNESATSNTGNAEQDSADYVEWLLSNGFGFDLKNKKGQSALHLAVAYNLQHILPTLLAHTCDVNFKSEHGNQTLLQLFLNASNASKSEFVYGKRKYKMNQGLEGRQQCPLQSEGFSKHFAVQIVRILLKRGVPIDHVDLEGLTAFDVAMLAEEQVQIVAMLFSRSVQVNDKFADKMFHEVVIQSTLKHADHEYYAILLRTLIAIGANVNSKDECGMTPVCHAVKYQNLNAVESMNENDTVDFSVITNDGSNLLHIIAKNDYNDKPSRLDQKSLFDMLVSKGCDVNAKNSEGQTPLHVATRNRHFVVVRKLVEHGADVNCRERETGWCPLHVAVNEGSAEAVQLLLDIGANLNGRNRGGDTPLHLAVSIGNISVLEVLLQNRAEVNARDQRGDSALVLALRLDCTFNARLLLEHGADVNDFGVTRVSPCYWKYIAIELALRYWIKLEMAKNHEVLDFIRDEGFQEVYENVRSEIENLKNTFIDSHTSLYGWLHMDPNRRYLHYQNEKLRNVVDSPAIKEHFPQYSTVILGTYRDTLARKSLLEPAKEAWLRLTGIHLPDLCLERIFAYLNTGDLFEMAEMTDKVD